MPILIVTQRQATSVRVPQRNGRQITLEDLATHTSGLPRIPTNFKPKDPANPYTDYTVDQLYEFLSSYTLPRDIGEKYEYSNLGGGLLGHVLSLRAGMSYEALVRSRITGPLHMNDTAITLSPELKARMAQGYNGKLEPAANWDLPTLAGAGALRSTANDLLTFVAANLGYTKTPLASAMAAMLNVRRSTGTPNLEIALAWHVFSGDPIVWHNGGTGGYRSFIGYDTKTRVGIVVLSNASTPAGVDDIGIHLLNPKAPLLPATSFQPPKQRTEIHGEPTRLDGYTGRYEQAPNFILTVTREGDHLFAQATGQPKFELFAESEKHYFLKVTDAQITFQTDVSGRATSLTLHQLGRDVAAKRIE
ncbi:MAG: serine hydrolase [Acidobacteriia bacterium]|nr:serine hydrolase [Terriglobia bacterium]